MPSFKLVRNKLAGLPVHAVIDDVVTDVLKGSITIVAASTGSGKSMMLPGALADRSDHQIVVLAPRRFLAIDAAFNVAELAEIKVGDAVGYALGQLDGESSQRSTATRVLYCTYGYAIRSGLINKAQTIVLDEVHEADEQISLARAILRDRRVKNPSLRVLEMSATVDPYAQARYWQPDNNTAVHVVQGIALACDIQHESPRLAGGKDRTAEAIVLDLLNQGRNGIVLFRPGVREVETSVGELKDQLATLGLTDVDVVGIHGGTPADERRVARSEPAEGRRKIIVGTNVIESGVNLRWLDAGVSDGYRKIPYYRTDTGASALILEDLPQAGLLQQIGRINRDPKSTGFEKGIFFLHAQKPFDLRRLQNGPAIQHQSLNEIAFQAASLGYDPTKLTWDIIETAHAATLLDRFEVARQDLLRLNLIKDDWSLTKDGDFIKHLPVNPETGAMLVAAKQGDEKRMRVTKSAPRIIRDVITIAAINESHGLRRDLRFGHKCDQHRTSDLLDAMNAFRLIRSEPTAEIVLNATEAKLSTMSPEKILVLQASRKALEAVCIQHNVSITGFIEVARLSDEISQRLSSAKLGIRIEERSNDDKYDAERYGEIQSCILSGNVSRIFIYQNDGLRDLLRDYDNHRNDNGAPFFGYQVGRGSVVPRPVEGSILTGSLREISASQSADASSLNVVTEVSLIPQTIFFDWAISRAKDFNPIITDLTIEDNLISGKYAGKARFEVEASRQILDRASTIGDERI